MKNYIDFLGVEPRLYAYGKERYVTKFGAVMSSLTAISILVLCLYFIIDYFDRKKLTLIYSQTTAFNRSMSFADFPIMFKMSDNFGNALNTSITYPIFGYLEFLPENKGTAVTKYLKYEKCDIEKHFGS